MDPVLQRLGDVTIQRLDKPKIDVPLENETNKIQEANIVNKRLIQNSPGPSYKKSRIDYRIKSTDEISEQSFSDESSDYEMDSDLESDIDINSIKRNLEENIPSDIEENPADFLPSLSNEHSTSDNSESVRSIKIENEEYDIDIKEKLKEMGEISFETVKKGEKPKKTEKPADNEVVVTATKKSNYFNA